MDWIACLHAMGSTPWPRQLAPIKAVGYNYAMA
jgi:hypothetical protein